MKKINYYTSIDNIEENAKTQIEQLANTSEIDTISIFPDIHYCSEKGIPVGLAFASKKYIFPLITGKDMGCGVAYLKIPKKYVLKPFDKGDYKTIDRESYQYTDEGLGGGNHFLSLEEDDNNWYIIVHTGTRNLGISMFQNNYKLLTENSDSECIEVSKLLELQPNWFDEYNKVLEYGKKRRKEFCYKLLLSLMVNGYVDKTHSTIIFKDIKSYKKDYLKIEESVKNYNFEFADSIHNHIRKEIVTEYGINSAGEYMSKEEEIYIHRKGATEINNGDIVVIPLSMTRGSLFVKYKNNFDDHSENLNSCSHGAGRKLSRTDTLKYWNASLKKKEREIYKENFSEMLDSKGEFSNGYIQEMDFAYKDSDEILVTQNFLDCVTKTTPIFTIKFTEI